MKVDEIDEYNSWKDLTFATQAGMHRSFWRHINDKIVTVKAEIEINLNEIATQIMKSSNVFNIDKKFSKEAGNRINVLKKDAGERSEHAILKDGK